MSQTTSRPTMFTVMSPPLNWFELFYDLVFVATIMIFSNSFSHEPTWENAGRVAGVFAAVWFVWLLTVVSFSQFAHDDRRHRGLILLQMFLVTLVAVAAGDGVADHTLWVGVLGAMLTFVTALIYVRAALQVGDPEDSVIRRQVAQRVVLAMVVTAVLFVIGGALTGTASVAVGTSGLAVLVVTALIVVSVRHPDFPGLDRAHLSERLGAFTIIVCGESFVKVAITAADGTLDGIDVWVMAFEFALVFSVWWAYFDDIPQAGIPEAGPRRSGWVAFHLLLHLALAGVAVGASKYIVAATDQQLSVKQLVMLALPLSIVYVALAGIGWLSPRRSSAWLTVLRVSTAALIGVAAVTWWQTHPTRAEALMGALAAITFIAATASSQLMLPTREHEQHHHGGHH
jgi:low temperature requirement protein LtrA